jgi:hypothetical protein
VQHFLITANFTAQFSAKGNGDLSSLVS